MRLAYRPRLRVEAEQLDREGAVPSTPRFTKKPNTTHNSAVDAAPRGD